MSYNFRMPPGHKGDSPSEDELLMLPYDSRIPGDDFTDEDDSDDSFSSSDDEKLKDKQKALKRKKKAIPKQTKLGKKVCNREIQVASTKVTNRPSAADAKEHAKKLVLSGKITISSKCKVTSNRPSVADAKELAKKLVLTGKITIPSNSHEEKTFKRPKVQKKKITTSTSGGSDAAAASGVVVSDTPTPKDNVGEARSSGSQTSLKPTPIRSYDYEASKRVRSSIIPPLDDSSINAPKRGPAIYVSFNNQVTQNTLRMVFGRFGRINGIKLTAKGVAFVTFGAAEIAECAINEINGTTHDGVRYEVEFAWRQPHYDDGTSGTAPSPWLSTSTPNQCSNKRSWDYKRRQVVYDDDDEI